MKDARIMHGSRYLGSAAEVRAEWDGWAARCAARGGFPNRDSVTLDQTGETTVAFVSDGRWVATCPSCNGGIAAWAGMDDGCCYDCGRVWTIAFPQKVGEIEDVLMARPERNRNWSPGETVYPLTSLEVE